MGVFGSFEKGSIPYFSFYICSFMAIAIFTTFINIYFQQLGFTIGQIGILTAIGPMVSMISQPMWGVLSDRTDKRKVLMIILVGGAVMSLVIPFNTTFLVLIFTLMIYWSFATSYLPLGDAITLGYLESSTVKYTAIRIVGAISFGLTSAFAGVMLGGNIGRIFYYNAAFILLTCFWVFLMKKRKKPVPETVADKMDQDIDTNPIIQEKSGLRPFFRLLKNKVLLGVYLSSFVFGLTMAFLHNFIGIRLTEVGANESQVGMALFIAAFSEIPIFFMIDRVFSNKKPEYLLMLSGLSMGIRLFIMFLSNSIMLIYFAQLLQGFSFMLHLYFCIMLLHEHSPPHLKATVQTFHAMVRMGAGAILGGMGGGFLAQHIGIQGVFLILSIFVLTTCFILPGVLILYSRTKKSDTIIV